MPRPIQNPRIPIWIGGGYPLKGPMERDARWDGACLYHASPDLTWQDWSRKSIRDLQRYVASRRPASTPFDIVVGGRQRREDWEQERRLIRSLADAGATWWIEWVPPADAAGMRSSIERGPVRA